MMATAKIDTFGAWCGVLYVVLVLFGFLLVAGFFPLHEPGAPAEFIARVFASEFVRIRIGMIILMFAALSVAPFSAVIARYLARAEGGAGVLTYSALLGGAGTMVLTFYPAVWWLVAAFRPERPAELTYLLNDACWLQFIGGVSMFYALPLAIATAAFADRGPTPIFPRWAGYYNIFAMLVILPDNMLFFFHHGPFAWNGLFGFWLPLASFGSWFFVISFLIRQCVQRDRDRPRLNRVPARESP